MGIDYMIACKNCKVTRNLDKFYIKCWPCSNRNEAIEMANVINGGKYSFPCALLVGFLSEHEGHDVVFFSEHDECAELLEPPDDDEFEGSIKNGFAWDKDYWVDQDG